MRLVNDKTDGVDSMPAANYNAQRDELENAVLSTDQTLDPDAGPDTDLNMLAKAMAAYANAGNVYQDSGVADAYVLSITTNLKTVTKYYDNMMIAFKAGATNTGASTINVNALGVKSLTLPDGTALSAGRIASGVYVVAIYNLSSTRFELLSSDVVADSIVDQGGGPNLKTKKILINDWDMVANAQKVVVHGVANYKKISIKSVTIREDSDVNYYTLSRATAGVLDGWANVIQAGAITLERLTGGLFDNAAFDSTGYNRGWIIIEIEG